MRSPQKLNLQIAVVVKPDDKGFHAFCPALKGLHVDGNSELEALENAKDAVAVYLDSLALHGDPLPVGPYLRIDEEDFDFSTQAHLLTIPWPILRTSGTSSKTSQQTK